MAAAVLHQGPLVAFVKLLFSVHESYACRLVGVSEIKIVNRLFLSLKGKKTYQTNKTIPSRIKKRKKEKVKFANANTRLNEK